VSWIKPPPGKILPRRNPTPARLHLLRLYSAIPHAANEPEYPGQPDTNFYSHHSYIKRRNLLADTLLIAFAGILTLHSLTHSR
jgi:hypothetical protein